MSGQTDTSRSGGEYLWGTWRQGRCANVVLNDIEWQACWLCTANATLGMGMGLRETIVSASCYTTGHE